MSSQIGGPLPAAPRAASAMMTDSLGSGGKKPSMKLSRPTASSAHGVCATARTTSSSPLTPRSQRQTFADDVGEGVGL